MNMIFLLLLRRRYWRQTPILLPFFFNSTNVMQASSYSWLNNFFINHRLFLIKQIYYLCLNCLWFFGFNYKMQFINQLFYLRVNPWLSVGLS